MIKDMKFVYFGSPVFSTFVLDELEKGGFVPSVVVTRPDKPTGRKQTLTPTPVKIWALKRNIPIEQPEKLHYGISNNTIINNCELGIVASYGKIIPKPVINLFSRGILNIHPSLLPKYRGPTPVQSAILNGDKMTGVSIMLLDEEMDHGPIIKQVTGYELQRVNYPKATEDLFRIGGQELVKIIPDWVEEKIEAVEQDHNQATYTKKFTVADAFIKPETITRHSVSIWTPSVQVREVEYAMRQVRALNPELGFFRQKLRMVTWYQYKLCHQAKKK